MTIPLILLAAAVVVLGVLPMLVGDLTGAAAADLLATFGR